jgi:hypothetical protein
MGITDEPNPLPVHIGGFGSFQVSLPPSQKSAIVHECTLPESSRMVALMPHMHRMGTSMTLELGSTADDLQTIYARNDWNFDQQTVDTLDLDVQAGQYARITCNYDNTTDRTVTYGESSLDEMCFLGVFWVETPMNCVQF